MSRPFRAPCYCSAYPFPHRLGGGLCPFHSHGETMCSVCGKPAKTRLLDFEAGTERFWRRLPNDAKFTRVTYCCEAPTQPVTEPLTDSDHPDIYYQPRREA